MRNIEARVVRLRMASASFFYGRGLAVLALFLLATGAVAQGKEEAQSKDTDAAAKAKQAASFLAPRGIPLTPEKRREVVERVLANPDLVGKSPQLKVVRITLGEAPLASGGQQTVTTVVLFDHNTGKARRVSMDLATDKLLQDVELPGRPQSSREEVDEAAAIVQADGDLARLLKTGGVLDGGFIVDDPTGKRRLLQFKMLTTDRRRLLRTVTVDLTGGVITADPVRPEPEPEPQPKPKEPDPKEQPKVDPKLDRKADPKGGR